MKISNVEKARELAIKYCKDIDSSGNECYNIGCEIACIEAMEWKDKERKELWRITRNHYQEWAEERIAQEKQQLIDKAAEWLRMTMDFFNNGEFNTEKFVNDFKQTMKRE